MSSKRLDIKDLLSLPLRWAEPASTEGWIPGWGRLPLTSVFVSLGVWVLSLGYSRARNGLDGGMSLFWVGIIAVYLPIVIRFVAKDLKRHEAVGMIFLLSLSTFLFSYLRSPLLFRGFDEFLHWRTAYDILQTGRLFTYNSLLPVSPLYPGLENATIALASLSGLSIITSGFVVLGVSRLVMLLSLYLIFERISKSAQVAGIATMIYTGSSTFLFFDSQYGYESVALPLAALSVYMLLRRTASYGRTYWAWTLLIAAVLFSIVSTHHVTSYLLIAFLVLWTCTDLYLQWLGWEGTDPFPLTAWLTFLTLLWVGTVGRITLEYLSPIISGAYDSLINLLTGQSATRRLFENSAGQAAVIIERIFALSSVAILGIGLLAGLWQWWLRYRRNSIAFAFAIAALVYPALPLMRLSAGSWEVSNRLSGFVYVALSFVAAIGMLEFPMPRWSRFRSWIIAPSVILIFVGGVVAGSAPQTRLPSPYLPAAESRSIDEEALKAAEWARKVLGPNNRMAADRTMTTLMGAYGDQRMVVNLSDGVSISGLFLHYSITDSDRGIIKQAQIRYLVVDRRISTALPILGYYFEKWEQLIFQYVPPVNISALEKFDTTSNASRIYDSGSVIIYDIGALDNAP